jgi:hypothetical protein
LGLLCAQDPSPCIKSSLSTRLSIFYSVYFAFQSLNFAWNPFCIPDSPPSIIWLCTCDPPISIKLPHLFFFVSQILCSRSNVLCISNSPFCMKSHVNARSMKSPLHVRFSIFCSVHFAFQIRRLSLSLPCISDSQFRIKSALS